MRARNAAQLERWLREPETILADILAAQTPKRKPTDPRPLWLVKAMDDGRARKKRERKRKALQAAVERQRERGKKYHRFGYGIPWRVIRAMEPGKWYGLKALCRSIGIAANGAGKAQQRLLRSGWAEKASNPAWDGRQLCPQEIQGGATQEPQFLYRLTAAGEKARRLDPATCCVNVPPQRAARSSRSRSSTDSGMQASISTMPATGAAEMTLRE